MKINIKNERIKRKFFQWLKEADGCCDSTVNNIEKAILIYEDFNKGLDLKNFSADKAIEFKKCLLKRKHKSKPIAITTYHTYLRYLRKFFLWLSWQSGYRSKILPSEIDYLRVTEKEERMATQMMPRNYPSLEYVLKLTKAISIDTDIDLRDRALIAFTLLSGMRDKAIITLPLHCFDEDTLTVKQDPRLGVETKFSKYITTNIYIFDEQLLSYVLKWVKHIKANGFGVQDPLFPRSKPNQTDNNLSFQNAFEVVPSFWKGTGQIREIFKTRSKQAKLAYFAPHTFRHLAVDLALKSCKTGEQIKAISQNFGHEHIATTLSAYANYDSIKLNNIIRSIDFTGKSITNNDIKLEQVRKILLDE